MRRGMVVAVIGLSLAAAGLYAIKHNDNAKLIETQERLQTVESDLLGHVKFMDYVSLSKQKIAEKTRFIAATVTRDEVHIRHIRKQQLIFSSDATVVVSYTTEYSFGFDMAPRSYDIVATPAGIEIQVDTPIMVASPAIKRQSFEVPSKGWLIDDQATVLRIYEDLPKRNAERGKLLAADPEIVALCEKKLIAFLSDFLSKQPGVKTLPAIKVTYKRVKA